MATPEQERIWFAREVFQLFVKAFTNLKLYPHEHVHVRDSVEAFASRLRSYTELYDVLRISVTQDALVVLGEPVYQEQNRNENLAFRLYVDGLRELSVARGVTKDEASRLAFVFYRVIVDPSADTTLLLWESEFTNVEYMALNSLSEAWEQPDYLSADSLDLLRDMNRNVDDIVSGITSRGQGHSFELSDGASELERLRTLGEGIAAGQERSEDEDIFDIQEDALRAFQKEVDAWGPDRMLQGLVGAALDGLALQPSTIGRANAAWLLQEAVETTMRGKDMSLLGELLSRLEGELELVEEEEDERPFRQVFEWVGRPENLDRLTELAQGQSLGGPQAFCRILALLGPAGLRAAVNTYLRANSRELKETLLKFIVENFQLDPYALRPLFEPAQQAEVVQSGLFLLSKQRNLDDALLDELLALACRHQDAKVSEYAAHLRRTMTTEGRMEAMLAALSAESRRDRLRAVQTLVQHGRREAMERLREVVESKDFLGRDDEERRAFFEAIRVLGGKASIGFLERQRTRATGLLNRKAVLEIRDLAAEALDRLKREG